MLEVLISDALCDRKSSRKSQLTITVKYSAARLHEKGVVLDIEGLPHSQYVIISIFIIIIIIIIMRK